MITSVLFDVDPVDNPSHETFEISLGPSSTELNLIWFALREYEDRLSDDLRKSFTQKYLRRYNKHPATVFEDRAFLYNMLGQIGQMKSELAQGLGDYLDDLN